MDEDDGKSKEDSEETEFDAKVLEKKKDGSLKEATERRSKTAHLFQLS